MALELSFDFAEVDFAGVDFAGVDFAVAVGVAFAVAAGVASGFGVAVFSSLEEEDVGAGLGVSCFTKVTRTLPSA